MKHKGTGDLSLTYMSYLRQKAKQTNREFSLTAEYLWELFLKQDRKCALSGEPLFFSTKIDSNHNIERAYHTASLDRINNDLDYIEGNVQWVHKTINRMRRQYTVAEYIFWCKRVSDHANLELSLSKSAL